MNANYTKPFKIEKIKCIGGEIDLLKDSLKFADVAPSGFLWGTIKSDIYVILKYNKFL